MVSNVPGEDEGRRLIRAGAPGPNPYPSTGIWRQEFGIPDFTREPGGRWFTTRRLALPNSLTYNVPVFVSRETEESTMPEGESNVRLTPEEQNAIYWRDRAMCYKDQITSLNRGVLRLKKRGDYHLRKIREVEEELALAMEYVHNAISPGASSILQAKIDDLRNDRKARRLKEAGRPGYVDPRVAGAEKRRAEEAQNIARRSDRG